MKYVSPAVQKKKNNTKRGVRAGRKLKKQRQVYRRSRQLCASCSCSLFGPRAANAELMNHEKEIHSYIPYGGCLDVTTKKDDGTIPGVRFKVPRVSGITLQSLMKEKQRLKASKDLMS